MPRPRCCLKICPRSVSCGKTCTERNHPNVRCYVPGVVSHLSKEAKSQSSELLPTESMADPQELAIGLRWTCASDTLGYKCSLTDRPLPTKSSIYSILAKLYDPLGFLLSFTTQAKVIVQTLWGKEREWDVGGHPQGVANLEDGLQHLPDISLPLCYIAPPHVFCGAGY